MSLAVFLPIEQFSGITIVDQPSGGFIGTPQVKLILTEYTRLWKRTLCPLYYDTCVTNENEAADGKKRQKKKRKKKGNFDQR